MKAVLPLVAVIGGVVLVVASLLWGLLFPAAKNWTPEKSTRMSQVAEEAHLLSFKLADAKNHPNMQGGVNPAELQSQYKEKERELAELKEEFNSIKDSPNATAKYLRWTGIAFVLLGGAASMVTREG